ncbi:hypothetical protein BD324DRAFT_623449 [Kockovaella imperatae]|uniref:Zn(2)-C6 fungal-type domain-containing protein n=1 Tax=Kockovaella imperatae TaxID=4999 RepID=A0A1Y1UIE6_9TREE|nr:hypothetical protein BD324DRAFT_623449 [Kockovaella imperatae]ORX37820.1 hypothetical protein BD324DRAFT_623449 [Kockovaella imperatae]
MSVQEPKAKRTHARRSCELCKVRKTRCELPDTDVASSSEPLPSEKSCHRCKVLALPCVVDDTAKKTRPPRRKEPNATQETKSGVKKKRPRNDGDIDEISGDNVNRGRGDRHGSFSGPNSDLEASNIAGPSRLNRTEYDSLDVLHGFRLQGSKEMGDVMPPFGSSAPMDSPQSQSMKLHGRPLELVCAMLSVAYGKKGVVMRGLEIGSDVNIYQVVDADMRRRLAYGVAQLQTFHPWLDSLDVLFSDHRADTDPAYKLLLSLVVFIASLSLPIDPVFINMRSTLSPIINTLRDDVMIQLPRSVHAAQALEMLSLHAPLGVLPIKSVNPRTLSVARGQASSGMLIISSLDYPTKVRNSTAYDTMTGGFHVDEVWTWMSLCAAEAGMALENESPPRPQSLDEARDLAERYLSPDRLDMWKSTNSVPVSNLIGRLSVCDRLCRIGAVHDAYGSLRGALDVAAADTTFDLVTHVNHQVQDLTQRFEEMDRRHDAIMSLFAPRSGKIETGWRTYRNLRKRYEGNAIFVMGLRIVMAAAYVPGGPLAFSGLPMALSTSQKPKYALARACNPPDMIPIIMSPDGPIKRAMWHWGTIRGEKCQEILQLFLDLAQVFVPLDFPQREARPEVTREPTVIVPIHECCCIAVEACKILMEMQRSSVLVMQRGGEITKFLVPLWYETLRQVCEAIHKMSSAAVTNAQDESQHRFESVAQGCSRLLDSMRRMAHDYVRGVEGMDRGERASSVGSGAMGGNATPQAQSQSNTVAYPHLPSDRSDTPLSGILPSPHPSMLNTTPSQYPHLQLSNGLSHEVQNGMPPGGYMDRSDRWMATDHHVGVGDGHNGPPPSVPSHMVDMPMVDNGQAQNNNMNHSAHSAHHPMNGPPGPQYSNGQSVADGNWPADPTPLDLLLSQMFNYPNPFASPQIPQPQMNGQNTATPILNSSIRMSERGGGHDQTGDGGGGGGGQWNRP